MSNIEKYKKCVDLINLNLTQALMQAREFQDLLEKEENDSDLHRKLKCYTVPNLNHWISGLQSGNIKDLNEVLNERINVELKKQQLDKKSNR